MIKKVFYFLLLLLGGIGYSQECPDLLDPLNGATNVPVNTTISWEDVVGINGYILSLGTTPGGTDILDEFAVGSATSYTPPLGLPESTQVYVTITLFFFDSPNIVCPSQSFTTEDVTVPPDCTQLNTPLDGSTNVNVGTNLSWSYAARATGYRISIGTAPGTGDIVNNQDVGNTLTFDPATDLPPSTALYVRIGPYNENGIAQGCPEESFTTGAVGEPPGCTQLITPSNGSINVPLTPLIEWQPVANATGYLLSIGSTPFVNDVLDRGVFFSTSTLVLDFEPNRTYFVEVIPFNDFGEAQGCVQESFSTILGCGPFIDPQTGELVTLFPEISFPDTIGICENSIPTRVNSTDPADGYRWFSVDQFGDEELLSETSFLDIFEEGTYRYEAYNEIEQDGSIIECANSKLFTTTSSSIAALESVEITPGVLTFDVEVLVSGIGDYEFSFNAIDGPYVDSGVFLNLPEGDYIIYVRDQNGCGILEVPISLRLPATGFPPYFSPNGDGINEYWQYRPPREDPLQLRRIEIYDRFGKLLAIVRPNDLGWDGTYAGARMPSSNYWFQAITLEGRIITGFFSLVRQRERS